MRLHKDFDPSCEFQRRDDFKEQIKTFYYILKKKKKNLVKSLRETSWRKTTVVNPTRWVPFPRLN